MQGLFEIITVPLIASFMLGASLSMIGYLVVSKYENSLFMSKSQKVKNAMIQIRDEYKFINCYLKMVSGAGHLDEEIATPERFYETIFQETPAEFNKQFLAPSHFNIPLSLHATIHYKTVFEVESIHEPKIHYENLYHTNLKGYGIASFYTVFAKRKRRFFFFGRPVYYFFEGGWSETSGGRSVALGSLNTRVKNLAKLL